ncbi:hypothetical protein IT575_02085 [bacterium]|nr:hypothetical protein [bacterium]
MSSIPVLRHSSSPAQLSVRQQPARLSVQQPQGNLSISSGSASLEIQHREGSLRIDSTAARASMKYFSMLGLLGEIGRISKQKGNAGVSNIVAEGRACQAIENGGGAIQAQARAAMFDNKQWGVVLMPGVPPSISYTPGSVEISARAGSTQVQFRRQAPIINVEPQRPSISFSAAQLSFSLPGPVGLDLRA